MSAACAPRWPKTRILFRGDSHYARPEAMEWCEANGIDYVFGIAGSRPLSAKVEATSDAVRTERALTGNAVVRGYAETRHKAKSWIRERRARTAGPCALRSVKSASDVAVMKSSPPGLSMGLRVQHRVGEHPVASIALHRRRVVGRALPPEVGGIADDLTTLYAWSIRNRKFIFI